MYAEIVKRQRRLFFFGGYSLSPVDLDDEYVAVDAGHTAVLSVHCAAAFRADDDCVVARDATCDDDVCADVRDGTRG